MINRQFIVDDINDFLKPNNHQWKTYFDKAECRAILNAIEKSYKYDKIKNTFEEILNTFETIAKEYSNKMENTNNESDKDFFNGQSLAYFDAYAFIKQKLLENDNG